MILEENKSVADKIANYIILQQICLPQFTVHPLQRTPYRAKILSILENNRYGSISRNKANPSKSVDWTPASWDFREESAPFLQRMNWRRKLCWIR
jgi:hypothetical protein